jgi:hypothetical protein
MREGSYIFQILVVESMLAAKVFIFVVEHSTSSGAVSDAIADEIVGNAEKWIVTVERREEFEISLSL